MFTDISIDLETLGTRAGSVITQIGLCAFNRSINDPRGSSSINIRVNPQSCLDLGMKADWSTIKWWIMQNEPARIGMASQIGSDIHLALSKVGDWVGENCGFSEKKHRVWGNGAGFDVTLLEVAFNMAGMPVPWDFRNVRDLRTLADLKPAYPVTRVMPRVAHDAEADATAQAEWIVALTRAVEQRTVAQFSD